MFPFKYEYFYWKGETLMWKFQSLACSIDLDDINYTFKNIEYK